MRSAWTSSPQPAGHAVAEALAAFGARADVRRALKLAELDMRMDSIREWAPIVRGLDDEALLTVAEFAKRAGLNDRAINIADRTTPATISDCAT